MNILMILTGLMISTAAWAAVAVKEQTAAVQQTNSISAANFSSATIGGQLPVPWQCSTNAGASHVTVETPAGRPETERWIHLVDDTDKTNTNFRQSFAPVTSGRLQVRVISNKDGGRLFFNLGKGAAAKPEDRALQLSIDSDGSLLLRGEKKAKTASQVKAGEVYLVRCDFEPVKDGKALRVVAELVDEKTQKQSRVEMEIETQVAITALRITSTIPDTGVDFYLTDLSLVRR